MSALGPRASRLTKQEVGKNIIGYYAGGYLGQYLVVLPAKNLVVVRMIRGTEAYNEKTDGLVNIQELAVQLVD
jgi:CubicO group peptidase (beta-lactamase class C family)